MRWCESRLAAQRRRLHAAGLPRQHRNAGPGSEQHADKVVGFYTDAAGQTHGFVYSIGNAQFVTVDDPNGVGTTVVNGINDAGKLVGSTVPLRLTPAS